MLIGDFYTLNNNFSALYVTIEGYCNIHWTSRHWRILNTHPGSYTKNHDSHEIYFADEIYLMGGWGKNGKLNGEIPRY